MRPKIEERVVSDPRPTRSAVLASVRVGRVVRLRLTAGQRQALSDRDGLLAVHVLRHALGARAALTNEVVFPLTDGFIAAVAARLGERIGIKRSRKLRHRLEEAGVIEAAGSYRPDYSSRPCAGTHRVALWLLAAAVRGLRRVRTYRASVGTKPPVKTVRWWEHPLFGTFDGLPPPEMRGRTGSARRKRLRRSTDETTFPPRDT
jgi:hypothetical protein